MAHSLLGPSYDDATIRADLDAYNLVYQEVSDPQEFTVVVAEALAQGQIIGHFDGRMEFGPRALGNRSILADPRGADTLNRTNLLIKFREGWRPFAPMVLAEQAAVYFEEPADSPYMQSVAYLRPAFRKSVTLADARAEGIHMPAAFIKAVQSDFSAVTHVDFSARLQTIEPTGGSRAGAILSAFHARTGCPMLLNTSFNVRGEPIVCSPKNAIECFLNTHLDMLAIGGFLVRRSAQSTSINGKIGSKKFAAD
jgi:carbamoyltransferase